MRIRSKSVRGSRMLLFVAFVLSGTTAAIAGAVGDDAPDELRGDPFRNPTPVERFNEPRTLAGGSEPPWHPFGSRGVRRGPPPHSHGRPCHRIEAGWTTAAPMPTGRSFAGVGVLDDRIYVVGGWISPRNGVSTTFESYDPSKDEWTVETPLPPHAAMHGPVVAVVDGKLYALGGLPTNEEAWQYDPETRQWMFRGYAGFGSTITNDDVVSGVVDGRVFIVDTSWGGWSVLAYDPASGHTERTIPRRTDVGLTRGIAGNIIDRRIYVVGGIRYSRQPFGSDREPPRLVADVEVFDIDAGTWTSAAPMHTPRAWAKSAVIDGKLYVVGGFDGDFVSKDYEFVSTMEIYDPATNTWTEAPGLPTPRYAHAVAAADGRLHVLGGQDSLLTDPAPAAVATVDVFSSECRPGRGRP